MYSFSLALPGTVLSSTPRLVDAGEWYITNSSMHCTVQCLARWMVALCSPPLLALYYLPLIVLLLTAVVNALYSAKLDIYILQSLVQCLA